ncbi:putative HTH-type transcriptional regulator YbaQ [compost metagenome]
MITMHPGEYLAMAYLDPLQMTQSELAKRLHVSTSAISRLVSGKADLSVDMAMRLSRVLDRSAESWLRMQLRHSLAQSQAEVSLKELQPLELEEALAG